MQQSKKPFSWRFQLEVQCSVSFTDTGMQWNAVVGFLRDDTERGKTASIILGNFCPLDFLWIFSHFVSPAWGTLRRLDVGWAHTTSPGCIWCSLDAWRNHFAPLLIEFVPSWIFGRIPFAAAICRQLCRLFAHSVLFASVTHWVSLQSLSATFQYVVR